MFFFLCIFWGANSNSEVDKVLKMNPKSAVLFVREKGVTAYDYGMDMLSKGETDEAYRYFDFLADGLNGEARVPFQYGRAWLHWLRFEPVAALREVDHIITNSDNELFLARSYYLVAMIHEIWGEYTVAVKNAKMALSFYKKTGKKGGAQRCYIRLFSLHKLMGDSEKANQYLEKAQQYSGTAASEGRTLDALAFKAFSEKDYQKAINLSLKALEIWKKSDPIMVDRHYSQLGLCYAMMGDYNKAHFYASAVEKSKASLANAPLRHFNSLTWVMLFKCHGNSFSALEMDLNDWLEKQPQKDHYIGKLLDEIIKTSCPDGLKRKTSHLD